MNLALYRKYRPQTFADLVGQNPFKTTLKNEIETGQIAHAYIFSGPRGCGKTSAARLIAKAVNCLKRKVGASEPCNSCESCREIMDGNSLDLVELDAASHTGVDNVRENIIGSSRFRPAKARYKVFIIDEAHMLSLSSFNALLKTIEEPPSHVLFILATTEIHKVPPTIISRCQRFDFKKIALLDLVSRLQKICKHEKVAVDTKVLSLIASHAQGCARDAETMLEQVLSLGEKHITLEQAQMILPYSDTVFATEFIQHIINKSDDRAIELINKLADDGVDLMEFTKDVIDILRKLLLMKSGAKVQDVDLLVSDLSLGDLVKFINTFLEKLQEMKNTPIQQLPLEVGVVEVVEIIHSSVGSVASKKSSQESAQKDKRHRGKNQTELGAKDKEDTRIQTEPKTQVQGRSFSLELVKKSWNEVLDKIKEYNRSLFSFLRLNKPVGIKENVIQIGVAYDFHKERIIANKQRIEDVFSKILGQKVYIECVKVEPTGDVVEVSREEEKKLQPLLDAFGGRIVE